MGRAILPAAKIGRPTICAERHYVFSDAISIAEEQGRSRLESGWYRAHHLQQGSGNDLQTVLDSANAPWGGTVEVIAIRTDCQVDETDAGDRISERQSVRVERVKRIVVREVDRAAVRRNSRIRINIRGTQTGILTCPKIWPVLRLIWSRSSS